jgi:hypothetical protein
VLQQDQRGGGVRSCRISPWSWGWLNPSTSSCTGPIAILPPPASPAAANAASGTRHCRPPAP